MITNSQQKKFEASESNTYDDYFELYDDWGKVIINKKPEEDVYREHLQTASKSKLIDIAIEGNNKYLEEQELVKQQNIKIEKLQTELKKCNKEVTLYNDIAYKSKIACLITIIACAIIIGVFYIYQFIKFRLRKYADKIRSETIETIKLKQNSEEKQ